MVSTLNSRSSGFGQSPGHGGGGGEHCVVFLGKTFYSHRASLHPGEEVTLQYTLASHPRGVEILLVDSSHRN